MKRSFLLIAMLLMLLGLWSVPAEQFVIGAYTQYMLRLANPPDKVFSALGAKLQGAGYNTALYAMSSDELVGGRLQVALNELSKRGIASVLDDWAMQENGAVGVTVMANSNYMKMEAEYLLDYKNGVFTPYILPKEDPDNDAFNTVFRHNTGKRSEYDKKKYSNGYAWTCDAKNNDRAGLVLTEPRFRWKPDDRQISRLICYDMRFLPSIKDNRLYLVIAMDWADLPDGEKVADIALTALKNSSLDSRLYEFGIYPDDAYQTLNIKSLYPDL
ncbi:MAG: hypothetical protein U1B83_00595, partial [Candidatus Cloacimonadaceae bacterium]|nr:hypothetical protein [Candidatus Cloacimonadaceae bacterium]